MEREKILPGTWLRRTEELIPGEHKDNLNKCLGATIIVTSTDEKVGLEGLIRPCSFHDVYGCGGKVVQIPKECLCDNKFFTIVASRSGAA